MRVCFCSHYRKNITALSVRSASPASPFIQMADSAQLLPPPLSLCDAYTDGEAEQRLNRPVLKGLCKKGY